MNEKDTNKAATSKTEVLIDSIDKDVSVLQDMYVTYKKISEPVANIVRSITPCLQEARSRLVHLRKAQKVLPKKVILWDKETKTLRLIEGAQALKLGLAYLEESMTDSQKYDLERYARADGDDDD